MTTNPSKLSYCPSTVCAICTQCSGVTSEEPTSAMEKNRDSTHVCRDGRPTQLSPYLLAIGMASKCVCVCCEETMCLCVGSLFVEGTWRGCWRSASGREGTIALAQSVAPCAIFLSLREVRRCVKSKSHHYTSYRLSHQLCILFSWTASSSSSSARAGSARPC